MIDFLKKINKENSVTIMVTSHDMDDLEEMAERILMISAGKPLSMAALTNCGRSQATSQD